MVLWFDVEKKNYTTHGRGNVLARLLWFDVEKKNYTTQSKGNAQDWCCGLM